MYIIAHRGFSFDYPENTMLAFEKAIEAGAKAMEFDVQLNKDGEAVVIHDFQLARLSTAHMHNKELTWVKNLSTKEFKALDVGDHKGDKFNGISPPLLSEVIEKFYGKIFLNIEAKVCNHEDENEIQSLAKKILELIPKNSSNKIMVSSFCPNLLVYLREFAPELCMGGITEGLDDSFHLDLAKELHLHAYVFNGARPINKEKIKLIKEAGIKAYAYTINVIELAEELQKAGADGIFTDRVSKMLKLFSNEGPKLKLA